MQHVIQYHDRNKLNIHFILDWFRLNLWPNRTLAADCGVSIWHIQDHFDVSKAYPAHSPSCINCSWWHSILNQSIVSQPLSSALFPVALLPAQIVLKQTQSHVVVSAPWRYRFPSIALFVLLVFGCSTASTWLGLSGSWNTPLLPLSFSAVSVPFEHLVILWLAPSHNSPLVVFALRYWPKVVL